MSDRRSKNSLKRLSVVKKTKSASEEAATMARRVRNKRYRAKKMGLTLEEYEERQMNRKLSKEIKAMKQYEYHHRLTQYRESEANKKSSKEMKTLKKLQRETAIEEVQRMKKEQRERWADPFGHYGKITPESYCLAYADFQMLENRFNDVKRYHTAWIRDVSITIFEDKEHRPAYVNEYDTLCKAKNNMFRRCLYAYRFLKGDKNLKMFKEWNDDL